MRLTTLYGKGSKGFPSSVFKTGREIRSMRILGEVTQEEKLADFGGDEELAAEFSNVKSCSVGDSGYHCSCYTEDRRMCCICQGTVAW
jgi:hypothetical protein